MYFLRMLLLAAVVAVGMIACGGGETGTDGGSDAGAIADGGATDGG